MSHIFCNVFIHLLSSSIAISRKPWRVAWSLISFVARIDVNQRADRRRFRLRDIVLSGCSKLSCFVNSREKLIASKIQLT